jgi:hypothetical protein
MGLDRERVEDLHDSGEADVADHRVGGCLEQIVGEDQEGGVDGRGGRQAVDQLLQVEGTVVDLEKHFWQTLQQIYIEFEIKRSSINRK